MTQRTLAFLRRHFMPLFVAKMALTLLVLSMLPSHGHAQSDTQIRCRYDARMVALEVNDPQTETLILRYKVEAAHQLKDSQDDCQQAVGKELVLSTRMTEAEEEQSKKEGRTDIRTVKINGSMAEDFQPGEMIIVEEFFTRKGRSDTRSWTLAPISE